MSGALVEIENTARELSLAWGQIGKPRAKRFKGAQFRRLVERFIRLLYKLEWKDFEEIEQFERVEKFTHLMIAITEAWIVTHYDVRHTAECQTFGDLLEKLRVARNGLREGLPPNPEKRQSLETLNRKAEEALFEILKPSLPDA
jgi:hypothetical protein